MKETQQDSDKEKLLQWHPAFFASIQIELAEEADKLTFEREHPLATKPMLIDVVIIKKNTQDRIRKNIGRIFRQHNIVEYKSPEDYLSIDDFYKVYGYTCFYKSSAKKQNSIPAEELTITFVCKTYPREVMKHLESKRGLSVYEADKGIYYLEGDIFPIQLIVTSRLSPENNLWLNSLTNDLKGVSIIEKISNEYRKHKRDELYKSVMNIIVRANNEQFKEATNMCEALLELFKDEVDKETEKARIEARNEGRSEGISIGIEQGIESTVLTSKTLGGTKEQTLDLLVKNFKIKKDDAERHLEKYW